MPCTACGESKHKGTIFCADSENAGGSLCIECFDEFRVRARGANGCIFGDCPAEFYMQRDPLNRLDADLGHRPRIPILCSDHLRELAS